MSANRRSAIWAGIILRLSRSATASDGFSFGLTRAPKPGPPWSPRSSPSTSKVEPVDSEYVQFLQPLGQAIAEAAAVTVLMRSPTPACWR